MRYIVKAYRPNKGTSKDKTTGNEFSWDKMDLQLAVRDDRTNVPMPVGEDWRETISIKNDFNNVVIKCGRPVNNFDELLGCEVLPLYDRWGKISSVQIISQNAKF